MMSTDKIALWPEGVPNSQGNSHEDHPHLIPYILEDAQDNHAAVIVLPGGGYGNRASHEGAPIAEWLNQIGLSAFVLHYRVAPYRHPVPLLDAQRAIRIVRSRAQEWHIDPSRLGILGFSAGGHLAASTGVHIDYPNEFADDPFLHISSRPDLMILCYPVITFGEQRHHGSMVNLIGEDAHDELRLLLSLEQQVSEKTPPAFLWHTANDGAVPVSNSLSFAAALSRYDIPFDLHIYENGKHGLGLAHNQPETYTWTNLCEKWLRLRGF